MRPRALPTPRHEDPPKVGAYLRPVQVEHDRPGTCEGPPQFLDPKRCLFYSLSWGRRSLEGFRRSVAQTVQTVQSPGRVKSAFVTANPKIGQEGVGEASSSKTLKPNLPTNADSLHQKLKPSTLLSPPSTLKPEPKPLTLQAR